MENNSPPGGFCVAPWLELVLQNDGSVRACGRNRREFGNWKENEVPAIWHNEEYRKFRDDISQGSFPDEACRVCYQAGTAQNFRRILPGPFGTHLREIEKELGSFPPLLTQLLPWIELDLGELKRKSKEAKAVIAEYTAALDSYLAKGGSPSFLQAALKLKKVGLLMRDYLSGESSPEVIGPFRQVQLVRKCNARCIMCPAKFTGDIFGGPGVVDLEERHLENAFSPPDDVVDFFPTSSEFLLYRHWRKTAPLFKASGQKVRLSTNGIMLTEENLKFMIENEMLSSLNVSLNGATKECIERVQAWVKFDKLVANIRNTVRLMKEYKCDFPLTFSFVVVRSNFHELPEFFRFVHELTRDLPQKAGVTILSVENMDHAEYRRFLYTEHPSLVGDAEWRRVIQESHRVASELGFNAFLYNFGNVFSLAEMAEKDCGPPPFVPRQVDYENVSADWQAHLEGANTREAIEEALAKFAEEARANPIHQSILEAFPGIPEAARDRALRQL